MSKRFHATAIALFVSAVALGPSVFAQTAVLDGRAFVADAGMKGKDVDEKGDVITFSGSTFHSSSCDQWGYSKAAYKASANGDAVQFEAETQSEKDGRLVWKG